MVTDAFFQLLAEKSGFSKRDLYKILSDFGDLIMEEVYDKGETVPIGGLSEFKRYEVAQDNGNPFRSLDLGLYPL